MSKPYTQDGEQFYRDGKVIGLINRTIQKAIYVSPRITKLHFFRKLNGWGIGIELLKDLKSQGVTEIQLRIDNDQTILTASVDTFEKWGVYVQYTNYESQTILPVERFTKLRGK